MSQARRYALVLVAAVLLVGCIPRPPTSGRDTIVFSSARTGSLEIWSVRSDGSNATQLTDNSVPDLAPQLSLDGKRIVFAREVAPETRRVWVMNADGSDQHEVLAPSISDGSSEPGIITRDREPSWSPDGHWIAFNREGVATQTGILTMKADGTSPRVAFPFEQPELFAGTAWSPRGTEIAFSVDYDCCLEHIDAVRANGSGSRHVTAPLDPQDISTFEKNPVWSPDGTRIAFNGSRGTEETTGVWVVNADGTNPVQLTQHGDGAEEGVGWWLPRENRIVFRSAGTLWTMKPDGTDQVDLGIG